MKPIGICIHHSLTTDQLLSDWAAIKRYHVEHNGWKDIGYHFGIELVGTKVVRQIGRPLSMTGAHTVGYNKAIGICVVGNYDKIVPSADHIGQLVTLIIEILKTFPHLTPDDIHYHNEFAPKSCPGTEFPLRAALIETVKTTQLTLTKELLPLSCH